MAATDHTDAPEGFHDDAEDAGGVGMAHPTVVPANADSDENH